jgi:L-lactate dehydrogenase
MTPTRLPVATAQRFATDLLTRAGLAPHLADAVAENLVAADRMGHATHGLALLPGYLGQIESGGMTRTGEVAVLNDTGASFHWNANRLPGAYVLRTAIDQLVARAKTHAVVTASIAECFHIGALQVYLEAATRHGLMAIIAATDPAVRSVAPFGGLDPVVTSNPIAYGLPTRGEPILIDLCTSTISNGGANAYARSGEKLPGPWLLDNAGAATDDPAALSTTPPGTILPLGGADLGYKGFGLGLMVEAMALALSGYGRNEARQSYGEGVFVQLIDPGHFAGRERFMDEMQALVDATHASRPIDPARPVRVPGEGALDRRRRNDEAGIDIAASVRAALAPYLQRYAVALETAPAAS